MVPVCLRLGPTRGESNWVFDIKAAPLVHWRLVLVRCSRGLALARVTPFSRQCAVQL